MIELYQVDAFTLVPFAGNPAGVCILDEPRSDAWMVRLAGEMNLSETAFLSPRGDGYDLRWFTPQTEVSLCGHATLASAHILWERNHLDAVEPAVFHTKSGILRARRSGSIIELDFPAREVEATDGQEELNRALQISPLYTGRYLSDSGELYLLEAESEGTIRSMAPDFRRLLATGVRAVIVTARSSDSAFDFVSRFFAPAVGIDEDPVTGSAHCCLIPYWSKKLGKTELTALQASQRTGTIACRWEGDRVSIGGQAVTIFRAELSDAAKVDILQGTI